MNIEAKLVKQKTILTSRKGIKWGKGKSGKTTNCLICGKPKYFPPSKLKKNGGKYCSITCLGKSKEGIERTFSDQHKRNISKNHQDVSKEKNPNWKGGIVKSPSRLIRMRLSSELKKWRQIVLQRDGYACKKCGSKERLEAHHIIAISECESTATLPMNGATLCRKCHPIVDEYYGGKKRFSSKIAKYNGTNVLIRTIPQFLQAYNTLGNYQRTSDGITVIFISNLKNEDFSFLIAIHEMVEEYLTRRRGLSEKEITKFDLAFEDNTLGDADQYDEPGNHPDSPYKIEHRFAENMERLLAQEMGIDFNEYSRFLDEFWDKSYPEKKPACINPEIGK